MSLAITIVLVACTADDTPRPRINDLAVALYPKLNLDASTRQLGQIAPERTFREYMGWTFSLDSNTYGITDILLHYDVNESEPANEDSLFAAELLFTNEAWVRDSVQELATRILGPPTAVACVPRLQHYPIEVLSWGSETKEFARMTIPQTSFVGVHRVANFTLELFPDGKQMNYPKRPALRPCSNDRK